MLNVEKCPPKHALTINHHAHWRQDGSHIRRIFFVHLCTHLTCMFASHSLSLSLSLYPAHLPQCLSSINELCKLIII
jgi:hypothetical protein